MNDPDDIALQHAELQPLWPSELTDKLLSADILRLDKIHPVISGNKWFKLKYHISEALGNGYQSVVTCGGAWSNHVVAAAYAARQAGLAATGIIRGERPARLSQTLIDSLAYGMQLTFVSRSLYAAKAKMYDTSRPQDEHQKSYIIPEGGGGIPGIKGCKEILDLTGEKRYSHVVCCIGTGTMFAGILNASDPGTRIIGIPVLKGMGFQDNQVPAWVENADRKKDCSILTDYHFGGYAKANNVLLQFMNSFYEATGIPTDFVYTGKLMFACIDLIKKKYFPPGSRVLIIHSGGLQGNASLPRGTLSF